MKIVLLAPASVIHTRRWFYALCAAGHEVALISQHPYANIDCPPAGSIHYLPYRGGTGYFLNVPALRKLLRSLKPDLVNAHYASGYGTLSALANFNPAVLSVWGSDVYDFPYEFPPLKMWLLRWILSRNERITSTSNVMADQVRKLSPSVAHIDVIPFGVDTNTFAPRGDLRDEKLIVIGTVKTLERKYGIDTTILAFARLWNDKDIQAAGLRAKLSLVIVGEGSQKQQLSALAKQNGIADCITFIGAVDHTEVPTWLNRFDIYVAASRLDSESFGVAIIEASSCGLPVIVSDKGGLPEVVEPNVTGFVAPAEDVEVIAEYMKTLVFDGNLRVEMGTAGRRRVMANYEWQTCVRQMIACYSDAVATFPIPS